MRLRLPFFFVASPFVLVALVACSGGATSGPGDTSEPTTNEPPATTPPPASTTPPAPTSPVTPAKPEDPGPTMPSAPMFEAVIGGKAVKLKDVKVTPTGSQYPSGTFYSYTVSATIDASTPIVTGQDGDARIEVSVGKTEKGKDACKEERGPADGFVEPVTALREVQVSYERWTGQSTVIASPTTTSSGACTMTILADPAKGNAWGEAKGSVQSSKEPAIAFELTWFQPVKW